MEMNKIILGTLLAGTIISTPIVDAFAFMSDGGGKTWQQGGLSTNSVSSGVADTQKKIAQTSAYIGAAASTASFIVSWFPWSHASTCLVNAESEEPYTATAVTDGVTYHGLNTDFLGAAVDGWAIADAYNKQAGLSEEPGELQAAVRNIAEREDLEGECEGDAIDTCNEVSAKLDGTEVHVSTLKNVGLEALQEVSGSLLITPEDLTGAASTIQTGFGTASASAGVPTTGTNGGEVSSGLTDEASQAITKRKTAHLQYTGTAGVARADLGSVVAESEKEQELSEYVGSGGGVVANIKVLCGLDLTLAQRLNLLNMLYGQQAANEAAAALQRLENN